MAEQTPDYAVTRDVGTAGTGGVPTDDREPQFASGSYHEEQVPEIAEDRVLITHYLRGHDIQKQRSVSGMDALQLSHNALHRVVVCVVVLRSGEVAVGSASGAVDATEAVPGSVTRAEGYQPENAPVAEWDAAVVSAAARRRAVVVERVAAAVEPVPRPDLPVITDVDAETGVAPPLSQDGSVQAGMTPDPAVDVPEQSEGTPEPYAVPTADVPIAASGGVSHAEEQVPESAT